MAFQPVPGTAEAIVAMSIASVDVIMTFYGTRVGGYTLGNINDLAVALDGWATTRLIPRLSSSATYNASRVRGLESINDFEATNTDGAGAGTLASPPVSNNVCIAVSRRSALTGRSARGRVYFPLTASHLTANTNFITTTARDSIVDGLNDVQPIFTAAGWQEVIVSRYTLGAQRPAGVTFDVAEYAVADLRVDSQRRRLPAST